MKTIKILEINLRNFKGARNVNVKFDERLTNIEGDNETGKTTIADAFNWVLFGKNSENKSDFSIKFLKSGVALSKLEHEVTAKFDIDSVEYEFKRIYKEKYTKKKGSNEAVFDGHFEELYINDVPYQLKDYNAEIEKFFQGSNFRVVTDPIYFNTQLKWEQRRSILMEIAGHITEQSIIDLHPELDQIPLIFAEGKTLDKKTDELNAKKRKIKEVMDVIPDRLDEIERSIDTELKPLEVLNSEKAKIEKAITEKESIITDSSKGTEKVQQEISALIEQKFEIQRKIKAIEEKHEADAKTAKSNLNTRKDELEGDLKKINSDIDDLSYESIKKQNEIDALREENKKLRAEYDSLLKTEIDQERAFKCPTCYAPISNEKIEALNTKFNLEKSTKLEQLKQKAVENNNSIASCQKIIESNNEAIQGLNKQINPKEIELEEIKSKIEKFVIEFDGSETLSLETKIKELDKQIEALKQQPKEDLNTEVKQEIEALKVDLDIVKKEINKHEFNSQQVTRKNDLMEQNQTQIDELSKIELVENQIKLFIKYHISAIENFINTSFEGVEFKLFEQQVNGGEKPVCVCLVKGVPFPDANTAGQINSGLQIIKMLQKHFGLFAPIFIDNRERVTKIIPFDTQIINLRVVEGLKVLTVN